MARRRVTQFFDCVSGCIEAHGGTVEKFAGDAVMAAFGIPRAHEDDAERALRAALEIRASVGGLGVECSIGVEAGEVVTDESDSTFATGQAVNIAARLQQAGDPNEILVGRGAHRLSGDAIELEPAGERLLPGFAQPVPVWRAVCARERAVRPVGTLSAPLIGRQAELDLLRNTFARMVRDRRAHLFTIYGDPGVGKSRLAREFEAALEGTTVLVGRCLPYGEGITYWPLGEMVKTAAGIADDDPADLAHAKLLASCGDAAVADVLALASGVLEAGEVERSQQEIAWAAREWAQRLAAARPLLLGFEDLHWAEEPLLGLIEHLAAWVREPLIMLCLARPDLLEVYPGWGGGRVRATAIELGPLLRDEAEELVDTLLAAAVLSPDLGGDVLDKAEGNPLFVEETVRMLAEGAEGRVTIPDTVQALIAARIDGLPRDGKMVLQRAALIGRIFWRGAVAHLSPDIEDVDDVLDDLLMRDFVMRESRSSITGEQAFRFRHIITREIAYSGLTKSARAALHAQFAAWLHGRGVEELVEIRAYHLDHAATLLAELDGAAPPDLTREAASALEAAGRRALARESNRSGRKLLQSAVELEPTLERRFHAARAAWRLDDIPAVSVEMERVRADAHDAGDRHLEGRALIVLGEVTAYRDADNWRSKELIEEGLGLLEPGDFYGRLDALSQLSTLARWVGEWDGSRRYAKQALEVARESGSKDLMSKAAMALASSYLWQFELDRTETLATEALQLAEESGGIVARGQALQVLAHVAELRDEPGAIQLYEQSIALFAEAGAALDHARSLNHLAELLMVQADEERAERLVREAVRMLEPLGDRGYLCESQRLLAEVLARRGSLDEAERLALDAMETVGPQDVTSLATTRMALGLVRAAQGRDDEAETLLREAVARASSVAPAWIHHLTVRKLAGFLRERGRPEDAAEVEATTGERSPRPARA